MLISGTLPRSVQAGVKENLGHKEEYEKKTVARSSGELFRCVSGMKMGGVSVEKD